jgi:predicted outer membrane repeat protein
VSGNTARSGGGIAAGMVTLSNCTVSGNTASAGQGGGISAGVSTLVNTTVNGNTAGTDGGGVSGDVQTLTNSTVSGNTASGRGGGLYVGNVTLLNVTITGNSAQSGGGVSLVTTKISNIRNTIVARNTVVSMGLGPDLSGTFTSGGHNLIGDGSGATGFTNGVKNDQVGSTANPIDPLLGPLANNGGFTKTQALLSGSPAIDQGDNMAAPTVDQRGVSRPRDGNRDRVRIVDIGAFEK